MKTLDKILNSISNFIFICLLIFLGLFLYYRILHVIIALLEFFKQFT